MRRVLYYCAKIIMVLCNQELWEKKLHPQVDGRLVLLDQAEGEMFRTTFEVMSGELDSGRRGL